MGLCQTCKTDHAAGECPEARQAADPPLEPGHVAGEYVIEDRLGRGGFGTVYRATHPIIGKAAAIKVLNPQYSADREMVARFVAEARAVNTIRHKNIVDIFSFGQLADGRRFFVMELLQGQPLEKILRRARGAPMPANRALPLLLGVARALEAAHAANIVHRDLKPENIFVVHDGENVPYTKLLDFGVAKLLGDVDALQTRAGTPIGTPSYMSPEAVRSLPIDRRADIYSFGVMLYRVLTGVLPFTGEGWLDVLMKHTQETPAPPSSVNPDLGPQMDLAILHMLEKDPDRRPSTIMLAFNAVWAAAGLSEAVKTPDLSALASGGGTAGAEPRASPAGPDAGSTRESYGGLSQPPPAPVSISAPGLQPPPTNAAVALSQAVSRPRPSRGRFLAVAAGSALILVVVAAGLFRARSGSPPQASAATAAASAEPPPVAPTAAPAPTDAPAATPPPAPTEVSVKVHCTPPDAEIFLGATKLGVAPGPVKLPRATGTARLTLRAKGYAPETVEVDAERDSAVSVKLARGAASPLPPVAAPPRPKPSKDLESPF